MTSCFETKLKIKKLKDDENFKVSYGKNEMMLAKNHTMIRKHTSEQHQTNSDFNTLI